MKKYSEQEKEIEEILKSGKGLTLPNCHGPCDECTYRAKEWEKLLGYPLVDESDNPLFYYE